MAARITPEQMARADTEHSHQVAFMIWCKDSGIPDIEMLYAVPNGGDRTPSVGARMKAEGVKRGVPDIVWPVPMHRWAGLYMELKKPQHFLVKEGGLSKEQDVWIRKLREKHYAAVVCYGWMALAVAVKRYMTGTLEVGSGDDPIARIASVTLE